MRTTVTIYRAHNYLRVTDYSPEFLNRVVHPFCKRNLFKMEKTRIPGTQKTVYKAKHKFCRMNNDKTELRISSGLLNKFVEFMQFAGYHGARAKIVDEPTIKPHKAKFEWKKGWGELRDNQKAWCEYQLAEGGIKVNNAATGFGKSVMATHTMVNMGVRTLVTALPRFVSIWIQNFAEKLNLHPAELS